MELTFGERHIKVNTLIALTGFLSESLDLVTPTTCVRSCRPELTYFAGKEA